MSSLSSRSLEASYLTIADPAALGVTPGAAGVGPEHVTLGVPHHQHCGALVQDPGHQLLRQSWILGQYMGITWTLTEVS